MRETSDNPASGPAGSVPSSDEALRNTARRVRIGIAVSMMLVLLPSLLALWTTRRAADLGQRIGDLHSVVGEAEALRAEVERSESAQRGYLLTGEGRFREASYAAELQAREHRDALVELLSDGDQEQLINELDALLETRFEWIHRVMNQYSREGVPAAVASMRLGVGIAAMDTLRIHLNTMTARHAALLVQQQEAQARSMAVTRVAVAASTVLTLLLLLVAGMIIGRDLRLQAQYTARREATERDLKEAMLAAGRANRAKADFLARVSHEMRTPLNAILGMAELLRDSPLNAEQAEYARTIQSSGEDLLSVVSDLLDSSKIDAGLMELESIPFSPRDVIESVAEVAAVRAEAKNLELALALAPHLPAQLRGDPTRFRQLLLNLLGNAVKFTDHGHVTVRADIVGREGDWMELDVQVADTGIGISPDNLERIFLPFVQADSSTSRRFGGTGLGLNIAQSLAHSMRGGITVESEPGRGSVFRLRVQFLVEDARPEVAGTELQGTGVLLLVENRTRLDGLERLIAAAGGATLVARTLAEAEAQLGRQRVDAVVMDVRVAGADALLRGAESPLHALPMVLLTRMAESYSGKRLEWPAGLEQVLTPTRQKRLLEALQRLIRRTAALPATARTSRARAARPSHAAPRILLAEDNAENRALVLNFLSADGYRIDVAETGAEAIERAARFRYDLILMDVDMPGVDGLDATRAIRAYEAATGREPSPIVALTAHAVAGYRERCLDAGMDNFATKPISRQALRQLVADSVDRTPVVLVVEDAPDSRLVMASFLRSEPYRLVFAPDGASALGALDAQRISIVLLDMSLPDTDGYQVAGDIRSRPGLATLPIIAVTGHTGAEEQARCLAAGCSGYLPKPVRRQDLLSAIADALALTPADVEERTSATDPVSPGVAELRSTAAQVRRCIVRRDPTAARQHAGRLRAATADGVHPRVQRSAEELVDALDGADAAAALFWVERVLEELAESERLAALRRTGLLDSPRSGVFDAITRRVAARLGVPVALVSLVDRDRQFFKSAVGLAEPWESSRQTPLSHSFCQHVVATRQPLVVTDSREHPVVKDNLAIPELGVIAYAGVPLMSSDGHVLGSLCAIDTRPRSWSHEDLMLLRELATAVEREIEHEMEHGAGRESDHASGNQAAEPPDPDMLADEALTASFGARFLESRRQDLPRLAAWIEQGSLNDVARLGHQLKGTAATFGFPQVGALGAMLETAAHAGDTDGARATLQRLADLLDELQ